MNRISHFTLVFLVGQGLASLASAQDILEQYYGMGVHAYFKGNYQEAEEYLNEVINVGGQDPRVYYFRGLSQIKSQGGCMVEAGMGDFEEAAQLEVSGKHTGDVSKALTRIQGPTRIAIEKIRLKARLAAKSLQFEATRNNLDAPGMSGQAVPPTNETQPGAGNATGDPFTNDPNLPGGQPTPMPTTPESTPTEPPNLFDAPSTTPEASPPSLEPSAPGVNPLDPFSTPATSAPTTPAIDPFAP